MTNPKAQKNRLNAMTIAMAKKIAEKTHEPWRQVLRRMIAVGQALS